MKYIIGIVVGILLSVGGVVWASMGVLAVFIKSMTTITKSYVIRGKLVMRVVFLV